jgi:hypothetical protein
VLSGQCIDVWGREQGKDLIVVTLGLLFQNDIVVWYRNLVVETLVFTR